MWNLSCGNTMRISIAGPLLLLLLPLVCGQMDMNTSLFIHYSQRLTWRDAQAFCRKYHTDLVTITSERENEKFSVTAGWIGLYRDDSASPWKWSRRNEIASFTIWPAGNPTISGNCAFKQKTALTWSTDRCDWTHTFNCYDERLVLVTENKTWEEVLNYCRALEAVDPSKPAIDYGNNCYDLATLITSDDYSNSQDKVQGATTDEVWTGLRYLAGQWIWVGGEKVQNKESQLCPAEGFCGVLPKNNNAPVMINDCKPRINFLCYKKHVPPS